MSKFGIASLLVFSTLISASAEAPSGLAICDANPLLSAIKKYSPECIESCPEVCKPLQQVVMTVLMDGDPVPLVCDAQDKFSCMVTGDTAAICKRLLDAAKEYSDIEIPRTTELFYSECAVKAPGVGRAKPKQTTTTSEPASSTSAETSEKAGRTQQSSTEDRFNASTAGSTTTTIAASASTTVAVTTTTSTSQQGSAAPISLAKKSCLQELVLLFVFLFSYFGC
eukprot:TRINITY_DN27831_c0_g1_i3.p1 TRINITY_DN27831_c0_g1~~TRINITY_DN27831_c0_g1_i3.p1  ORF type:complete len:240 (+),score=40.45 TRINITY_DN27831_c0_g1_i3:48-722(+)